MIFFVLSGEMIFLSPENMILFFRQKVKDDLSQKIQGKMIFSSNILKKWSFQKKIALEHDLSCIIWKGGIFFTRKYDIFSLDGKWKISFLKVIDILD